MFKLVGVLVFVCVIQTALAHFPTKGEVRINEVYVGENSWVELYNTLDVPVQVNGYYFKFLPKRPELDVSRISQTTIAAKEFLVVKLPSQVIPEGHLIFVDPSQEQILDSFTFGGVAANILQGSYYRSPDGGLWSEHKTPHPTPGSANPVSESLELASEFQVHVFNVGQGDSQLIVFPSGFTVLIDVYESNWNSNNGAEYVASRIREITGGSYVDVGVLSHLHLDHIGYAGYGGFWHLIEKENIQFGKIIDRDAGQWVDYNSDGLCDPDTEIQWNVVGTFSGTAANWLCYATDPANQKIYGIREIAELCSTTQINPPDTNGFVQIVSVDAIGAYMIDGTTPVTGNYSSWSVPPSENDFSVGLLVGFGNFRYVTMGDLDGDYDTSSYGYTYNDVEAVVAPRVGHVDVYHANHHGSSHSSSQGLIDVLRPTVSLISCGVDNSYGHPDQTVLNRLLNYGDVFLTSDCDTTRNYGTAERLNKDILLYSQDGDQYFVQGLQSHIRFTTTAKLPSTCSS